MFTALASLSSASTRKISEALTNLKMEAESARQRTIDPRAMLQELREAHLARFVALNEQKLASHQSTTYIQALSAKHLSLSDQLKAQAKVAGLKARIEALRLEVKRLESIKSSHQSIRLQMQREIDEVTNRAQVLESLTLLAPRIQSEDLQMMMKWSLASGETGVAINWR